MLWGSDLLGSTWEEVVPPLPWLVHRLPVPSGHQRHLGWWCKVSLMTGWSSHLMWWSTHQKHCTFSNPPSEVLGATNGGSHCSFPARPFPRKLLIYYILGPGLYSCHPLSLLISLSLSPSLLLSPSLSLTPSFSPSLSLSHSLTHTHTQGQLFPNFTTQRLTPSVQSPGRRRVQYIKSPTP